MNTGQRLVLILAAMALFWLGLRPVTEYDTFFGIKIGELVVQTRSIPHQEVFSWSAQGRYWIAFESFSQVLVYLLHRLGGFVAIEVYVATGATLFFLLAFFLFKMRLGHEFWTSLGFSSFLAASLFEFFVARPQLPSYLFFITFLSILLAPSRPGLFLTLLLSYLWINAHGSFIFLLYFFASFATIRWLRAEKKQAKDLIIFGFLSFLVTLLPPLGTASYRLVWEIYRDLPFLSAFINEWQTLPAVPYLLYSYTTVVLMSLLLTAIFFRRSQKVKGPEFLALPLLPIIFLSFTAYRHVPYGTISALVLVAAFLPKDFWRKSKFFYQIVLLIVFFISLWLIFQKRQVAFDNAKLLPINAVRFLKEHHLKGRVFNQIAIGGYLIYSLYPEYQVFFDGRAEVYHCCEMRDFYPIITAKTASREVFTQIINNFLNKYQFSFAIFPIGQHNPLEVTGNERMADVLLDQPDWVLVYVDDQAEIFVKKDGQNDQTIKQFGMMGTTPYRLSLYQKSQAPQAFLAYQHMQEQQDSSLVETAIGELSLYFNRLEPAQAAFQQALRLNPQNGRALLGLGQIAWQRGDTEMAVKDLTQSLRLTPYLGQAYLWLAKAYQAEGRDSGAVQILKEGLAQPLDLVSRKEILHLLNQLQ